MIRDFLDLLGQHRDLDLGRPGVLVVRFEVRDDFFATFSDQCHEFFSFFRSQFFRVPILGPTDRTIKVNPPPNRLSGAYRIPNRRAFLPPEAKSSHAAEKERGFPEYISAMSSAAAQSASVSASSGQPAASGSGARSGGLSISKRVAELKPSVTVAFMNRAKNMKAQGLDVLGFAAGEPDFDTPQVVKDAAIQALNAGMVKYMPTLGDPETRKVLAEKLVTENGIPTTADHIAISAGGKHSLYVACQCLFDFPAPGEAPQEGILPVPAWVSYAPIIEIAGGKVAEIQTDASSDFKITPEQLKKAINPRTRAFFINSPSNPCGTMYSPAELKALAQVIAEAAKTTAPNLVVVSDELYEKIVYGGIQHFSMGSVPEIAERTLTINGLSKAYAMTGWRIGYACGSGAFGKKMIDAMGVLQGQMTTNITSFTYPAIRTAITKTADEVENMRRAFAAPAQSPRPQVPEADRCVLRVSRCLGALRQDERRRQRNRRAQDQQRDGFLRGAARGTACGVRPRRGFRRVRQELRAHLVRVFDRSDQQGRGSAREVHRRAALIGARPAREQGLART